MRFLRLDRALGLVAILSAVALTASGTASASDWPMFGLDPAHSGNDTAETLLGPANVASSTLAWSAAIGNDERCSPVAAGGLVYDVTQDYENQANTLRVQAFHADSGASAWETKLVGEWCFGATPAVGGGLLFVPDSNNGNLTALDAATGAVVWTHHFAGALYAPLTYASGTVYVGDGSGEVTALDGATGSVRWSYGWGSCCGWGGDVETAPAVADGRVVFGSNGGVLFALDASTGSLLWHTPNSPPAIPWPPFSLGGTEFGTDNSLSSSPTIAGGVIYIAEHGGAPGAPAQLVAIDETTGNTIWTGALDTTGIVSAPAVADGSVFVGDRVGSGFGVHGTLWAFPTTCTGACAPTWSGATGGIDAAPSVANHVVYVTSGPGNDVEAYATDCGTGGATCTPLWRGSRNVPGGIDPYVTGGLDSPIVVDGTIFANGWSADLPGHPALLAYRPTAAADTTPPATTVTLGPSAPNGSNGWYVSPVHVTVSAVDNAGGSGVAETRCALDPATPPASFADLPAGCAYTGAGADVGMDGRHTLYAASVDKAGNAETPVEVTFKVDRTPPVVTYGGNQGVYTVDQSVAITCTATDATSGVATTTCANVHAPAYTFAVGSTTLSATATDDAGNTGSGSTTFAVNVTPSTLCTLTTRFVEGSPRYQLMPAAFRAPANAWLATACGKLDALVGALTPQQKLELVAVYKRSVDLLAFAGFLDSDQATVLKKLADALAG